MSSLNIYTAGDGLYDTHVTLDDIQKAMQQELHTDATFGENRTATNIGDGKGIMSRICLIEADWQNVKGDEHLPTKFVAKLCSLMNLVALVDCMHQIEDKETFYKTLEKNTKKMHNAECTVYEQMKIHKPDTAAAEVYCIRKFTCESPLKGMIIMEFMENCCSVGLFDNLSVDSVKQALRAHAKWSAMSLNFPPEVKETFSHKPFRDLYADFFQGDASISVIDKVGQFGNGKFIEQAEKLKTIIHDLHDFDYYDNIVDEVGMQRVLCHGDLWSANVLWTDKNEDYKLAAIIDFQISHFGTPGADILRIICASLKGAERQENFENLVRYFYDQFNEEVDGEAPFTYEQLLESCKRLMPISTYMIYMMIPTLFDIATKDMDEDEKEKALQIGIEKVEHLFEDTFKYWQRSRAFHFQTM